MALSVGPGSWSLSFFFGGKLVKCGFSKEKIWENDHFNDENAGFLMGFNR